LIRTEDIRRTETEADLKVKYIQCPS